MSLNFILLILLINKIFFYIYKYKKIFYLLKVLIK